MGKKDDQQEVYFKATDMIISFVEKRMSTMKTKFLCGNKMTTPDFQMAHIIWTYWKNPGHSCGETYTKTCQEKLEASDKCVQDYVMRLHDEMKHVLDTRKT